ncbi:MAG TPA: ATP-binding cassette domain-containing protein [Solirubrobacteraceae bacterium]|jgi:ABC-type multidrug transport system ATPase subunit|nr:ATP-binding cassette domain-containing protein [Solirubrobacteraceae bacterium]
MAGSLSPQRPAVLEAAGVTVRRGRRDVLAGVALRLGAGTVVQLAGANGSGKTSLLRVLAGLTPPRTGSVRRAGAFAFVPEKVVLAPALGCAEWLSAMRGLRGLEQVDWAAAVAASGLEEEILERPAAVLSKGMLQRLALLEAIHAGGALLLLDEPFSGLDPEGRAWLGDELARRSSAGLAVLFTDHSGGAGGRLSLTEVLRLRDGACERELAPAADDTQAAQVAVRASHPDGRSLDRVVPAPASDDLLGELLAAGWHVAEVRSVRGPTRPPGPGPHVSRGRA